MFGSDFSMLVNQYWTELVNVLCYTFFYVCWTNTGQRLFGFCMLDFLLCLLNQYWTELLWFLYVILFSMYVEPILDSACLVFMIVLVQQTLQWYENTWHQSRVKLKAISVKQFLTVLNRVSWSSKFHFLQLCLYPRQNGINTRTLGHQNTAIYSWFCISGYMTKHSVC